MIDNIKKYWFLYGLITFIFGWFAIINSKTFDNPEQKIKVIDHVNEVPSDVENYKREVILIEQQEVLIEQTEKMNEFYGFAIKKFTKDSIVEKAKEKSRAGRDSTNRAIDKKLEYILKHIDTIN